MKNGSIRAAILLLSLSFSWSASPARAEPGKLYRYTSTLMDGTGAGDELLFVSGSRAEVFAKLKSDDGARLLAFDMDGLEPRAVKLWWVSANQRELIGTIESLPAEKAVRSEIFPSGRPAETVAVPVSPWALSDTLSLLNLAFAARKDPEASFTMGMVGLHFEAGQPPVRFAGPMKASYVGEEERGGVPTRKYRLEGEGVQNGGGFAWVHREENRIEALETDAGKGPEGIKLQLVSARSLDSAGWEEEKRAQLGEPTPTGPVDAVEVKPHPCRVPGYEKEVLCATYPVWENRETKQGRKIGLNIVIPPRRSGRTSSPTRSSNSAAAPGRGSRGAPPGMPGATCARSATSC